MIRTSLELREYLLADKIGLGRKESKPALSDFIWRFEISLRHLEYYCNLKRRNPFQSFFMKYWQLRYIINSIICGFEIPLNVFGKGLSIAHKGTIVVNGAARIGDNCRIHTCVNIGTLPGTSDVAPIIGDDVYIGPGAKIWGGVRIGNNVMIGANSCVGKDVPDNVCVAGAPAKIIKDTGRLEIETYNSTIVRQDNKIS